MTEPQPLPWLVCGESAKEIQAFVGKVWSRLQPGSDADVAERAFLDGQLLGLAMRLISELEAKP